MILNTSKVILDISQTTTSQQCQKNQSNKQNIHRKYNNFATNLVNDFLIT